MATEVLNRDFGVTMTPIKDDASKFKLTLRDAILLLVGSAAMYGAQIARDASLRAQIELLGEKFDNAVVSQNRSNAEFQRQIDQWRQQTNLNASNIADTQKEVAELKGILMGAGIKGVPK